ncbi:MAG TPA: transporter substrate-binding domain-containing protein [Stellaceae bacterium]|nr:transporter substrate-binding domain-containing protein [Stellaceae bacterium]
MMFFYARTRLLASAIGALLVASPAAAQTIHTGVDATFAPHAMPKLGGGLEGFNIDMANEIAKRLHRPIEIEGTQFSGLIAGLNAKKYDWIAAPTTVTPERAKQMLFTEGYLDTDYQFLIKKGEPDIKSLEDLKGKTIALNKGSAYEAWAKENAEKYGFKYDVYDTNADAVQAVLSGRAFANLAGNTVVAWAAKQNPMLQLSYTIKTGLVWAIPFRIDDQAGRDQVDDVVKCMKMDGTFARLSEKWFGTKPAPDSAAVKVNDGHGVPGMPGYEPTSAPPKCG